MNKLMKPWLYIICLAWLSAGCVSQHLNNYKTALEAFNRASAASNQNLMNPEGALTSSPESEYRTARAFIMKAMGDTPENSKNEHGTTKLATDGLLLTAYNIRSLSEWKLGMYSSALKTAKACRQTFENDASVKQQRDYIVMEIMEGLIYNDSVATYIKNMNADLPQVEPTATEASYLKLLMKSMDIVSEQRKALPADHPLQSYLCISQLSIAKNWKNLVANLSRQMKQKQSDKLATWNSEWKTQRESLNDDLKGIFATLKELLPADSQGIYQIWKKAHVDVAGI